MDELSGKRLVLAADEERRRIERELHDGPQQDLVALIVNLQIVRRRAGADPLLDEIARDAQRALDALRTLSARISPPLGGAAGLAAALRSTADGPMEVHVDLSDASPAEIVRAAYFCCVALHGTTVRIQSSRLAPGRKLRRPRRIAMFPPKLPPPIVRIFGLSAPPMLLSTASTNRTMKFSR